jgi:hypothetical protein
MVLRGRWRRRRIGAILHGLQPVDEECKAKVAAEKLGIMTFKLTDDNSTHLKHHSTTKTQQQ